MFWFFWDRLSLLVLRQFRRRCPGLPHPKHVPVVLGGLFCCCCRLGSMLCTPVIDEPSLVASPLSSISRSKCCTMVSYDSVSSMA